MDKHEQLKQMRSKSLEAASFCGNCNSGALVNVLCDTMEINTAESDEAIAKAELSIAIRDAHIVKLTWINKAMFASLLIAVVVRFII